MKWRWICLRCSVGGRKFVRHTKASKHIRKHYEQFHPDAEYIEGLFIGEDNREHIFEEDLRNEKIISRKTDLEKEVLSY